MYYDIAAYSGFFVAKRLYYNIATYSVYDSVADLNLSKNRLLLHQIADLNLSPYPVKCVWCIHLCLVLIVWLELYSFSAMVRVRMSVRGRVWIG